MRTYHELQAWQEALILVREVYSATRRFPQDERFGLTAQLRKGAVSVPSNIAEGVDRGSDKEFGQFLIIARGSFSEIETQLLIAKDLRYLPEEMYAPGTWNVDTTFPLIGGLIRSLRKRSST